MASYSLKKPVKKSGYSVFDRSARFCKMIKMDIILGYKKNGVRDE